MDPSPETSRAFQGSRKNSKKGKKSLSVGSEALPGARGRSEPRAAGIRPAQESSGFSGIRGSGGGGLRSLRSGPGMPQECGKIPRDAGAGVNKLLEKAWKKDLDAFPAPGSRSRRWEGGDGGRLGPENPVGFIPNPAPDSRCSQELPNPPHPRNPSPTGFAGSGGVFVDCFPKETRILLPWI